MGALIPSGKVSPDGRQKRDMPLLHVVLHLSVSHKGFLFTCGIISWIQENINSQKANLSPISLQLHVKIAKLGRK